MSTPCRWIEETEHLKQSDIRIDLHHSFGPCLAIHQRGYVLDASSAGLSTVLGFNASPLFGTIYHADTWQSDSPSPELARLQQAFEQQLSRLNARLGKQWCNSPIVKPVTQLIPQKACPAQLARSYIQASMLEQFPDQLQFLHDQLEQGSKRLIRDRSKLLRQVVIRGTSLELTFADASACLAALQKRFRVGLNFDRGGPRCIVLHLNLSYRNNQLEWFWNRLNSLLDSLEADIPLLTSDTIEVPASIDYSYRFAHRHLWNPGSNQELAAGRMVAEYLTEDLSNLNSSQPLTPLVLDFESYPRYRTQILELQQRVYEPARQSPASEFDAIFQSSDPVAILVLSGERIAGMALAGPIHLFGDVRGNATDPFGQDANTLYMVDVTVLPDFRGGLGRILKGSLTLLARLKGYSAIHGRNRDRLARGMWAVNLSLGSYELQHLVDDYPDEWEFRDCLYYRCPLAWPEGTRSGKSAATVEQLAKLVNGPVTLVLD